MDKNRDTHFFYLHSFIRYRILRVIIIVLFLFVALRFLDLQVFSAARLSNAATGQWITFSPIKKLRGNIVDCNGTILTQNSQKAYVLIQPRIAKSELGSGSDYALKILVCEKLGISLGKLTTDAQNNLKPLLFEVGLQEAAAFFRENPEGIMQKGISIFYTVSRYGGSTLAKHLLGYLNDKDGNGMSGIEKSYDQELATGQIFGVSGFADGRHNLLDGLGYRIVTMPDINQYGTQKQENVLIATDSSIKSIAVDSQYVTGKTAVGEAIDGNIPGYETVGAVTETGSAIDSSIPKYNIKLTINSEIQRIVENIMNAHGTRGAVVVENVLNGDIAAIASKPDFDQNRVSDYLNSPGKELFNRATASYNLGSIFKIVDVAALMEMNGSGKNELYPEYFCSGSVIAGGNTFKCSSYPDGHGTLDLTKAFAVSCNSYFIQTGLNIGYRNLINMAGKFGLGSETGLIQQGIDESPGLMPLADAYYSQGDIANISIGQGQVMASPLQVANMAAIIANGGIKNRLNIVDSVVDDKGNKIRNLKIESWERVISSDTASKIAKLMKAVMTEGTGSGYDIAEYGGACGKTGTAETGQYENGTLVVHAWFTGYFPEKTPKYSISVFVENGRAGRSAAAPIFSEIAAEIMKKGL